MALRRMTMLQSSGMGRGILRAMAGQISEKPANVMGLRFRHPLGIAAGFDKDARVILALQELGFAFVEVGTVTPRPQTGNPKPRIWRFPEAEALVNALGFPGEGMQIIGERLRALRSSGFLKIPIGINIGKNADTSVELAVQDYIAVFSHLSELGDYFVINVSSPNTAGLRDLQAIEKLRPLLGALAEENAKHADRPLLVKIAPDLADEDVATVGQLAKELNLSGIVAGNTTIQRNLVARAANLERGGLSGAPQFPRTRDLIKILRSELKTEQVIIAAGGISNSSRFQECMSLGADLVQVYTPFIYHGPRCCHNLLL